MNNNLRWIYNPVKTGGFCKHHYFPPRKSNGKNAQKIPQQFFHQICYYGMLTGGIFVWLSLNSFFLKLQ